MQIKHHFSQKYLSHQDDKHEEAFIEGCENSHLLFDNILEFPIYLLYSLPSDRRR